LGEGIHHIDETVAQSSWDVLEVPESEAEVALNPSRRHDRAEQVHHDDVDVGIAVEDVELERQHLGGLRGVGSVERVLEAAADRVEERRQLVERVLRERGTRRPWRASTSVMAIPWPPVRMMSPTRGPRTSRSFTSAAVVSTSSSIVPVPMAPVIFRIHAQSSGAMGAAPVWFMATRAPSALLPPFQMTTGFLAVTRCNASA